MYQLHLKYLIDYGIDPTKLSTEDVKSILGGYYTSVMQLPHPDNKDFKINARFFQEFRNFLK